MILFRAIFLIFFNVAKSMLVSSENLSDNHSHIFVIKINNFYYLIKVRTRCKFNIHKSIAFYFIQH